MKKYAELRRARFDRLYPVYKDMVEALESRFITQPTVHHYHSDKDETHFIDTEVVTSLKLRMKLTDEMIIFLSDYIWFTGIPLRARESDGYTYISILEKN